MLLLWLGRRLALSSQLQIAATPSRHVLHSPCTAPTSPHLPVCLCPPWVTACLRLEQEELSFPGPLISPLPSCFLRRPTRGTKSRWELGTYKGVKLPGIQCPGAEKLDRDHHWSENSMHGGRSQAWDKGWGGSVAWVRNVACSWRLQEVSRSQAVCTWEQVYRNSWCSLNMRPNLSDIQSWDCGAMWLDIFHSCQQFF